MESESLWDDDFTGTRFPRVGHQFALNLGNQTHS